jgi:predicted short-subunit dehydrogenase-like oxidoreductase (DUF2520 family)
MQLFNISFLGAGKVAEALCLGFQSAGHHIKKIVSPGKKNGPRLAALCSAEWSSEPVFGDDSEIVIVSVPDHALKDTLTSFKCAEGSLVAHTAGSFGLEVFPDNINLKGVFYPLQTFSEGREIDFREITVFTEASDKRSETKLASLAESAGFRTYSCDAEHRRLLHIAAVFVSNFTNHMLVSGKLITGRAGFPFEVLKPLIRETINKALDAGPEKSQTGPAFRYDLNTIEKHLELLSFTPDLQKVYREISKSIMEYHKAIKSDE